MPAEPASPHFIPGRHGRRVRGVVLHTTVGSFESAAAWFADPASLVSAHYLVGLDGCVARFVDERDAARHAGTLEHNLETIGIEFEDGGDPAAVVRGDAQYRAGAALIARIAERWSLPLDREHVLAHRELDESQSCPGNLDVDRLLSEAQAVAERRRERDHPRLVCLLPARNAEHHVPGYLESAGRFADAVLALDDGSTDATAQLLERSPLVERVLRNPRRPDYSAWDDAANRNRLLATADATDADWLLWLDADERLAEDDGAALRELVERDALPGLAYGFRIHRMVGDEDHYDAAGLWVYRLFAHAPGQRLAPRRLHGVPVPDGIAPEQWVRTTIRIKHLASLDGERRRARYEKYAQADPHVEFQPAGYAHLLEPPGAVRRWEPRASGAPLLEPRGADDTDPAAVALAAEAELDDAPALSAIVIAHRDEDRIERVVRAVVHQECPEPFDVIVVTSGGDRSAAIVRERFPNVTVVELPGHALPGAARNAGLRAARGEFVSFPGSHVELPPGSLAARLRAHRAGHAMVTGTIYNGTTTAAGWASYFLDNSAWLPGRPSGPLAGPPDHCSYMRHHLLQVGGFREDMRAGEDTLANRELARLGYRGWRAADIRLWHRSPCATVGRLVTHHFTRGRALGRIYLEDGRPVGALLARYLPRRLALTSANVARWGGPLRRVYRRVLPLVVVGAVAAWAGCAYELLVSRSWRGRSTGRRPSPSPSPRP